MVDTLPTTPESAASGTTAALYADTQGALGVPRVTAGIGVPAYAGIPATHRDANPAPPPASTSSRPRWPASAARPPAPSPPP